MADRLILSPADIVLGGFEVEERFIEVINTASSRQGGEPLMPPEELNGALLRWREMRVRHTCRTCPREGRRNKIIIVVAGKACCGNCGGVGDYRHTDSELKALREIAYWTLVINAELRGQPKPHPSVVGL